jgi:hypothetical protein
MPRDREDFGADIDPNWSNDDEREWDGDDGDGGPEFEDDDYCSEHECWKPYCKDKHGEGE